MKQGASEKWPNFFIVGAPKSGTTAFYLYLRQHPEVFLPESAKEPHFFSPEFRHPTFINNTREYAALFSGAGTRPSIGEASVFYLYSRHAPGHIRESCPDARIIIMLRNPVDMIYALHNEHHTNGIEKYRCFEDALDAEPRRESGEEAVPQHVSPEFFFYRKIGNYSQQVKRYQDCFPSVQIHYIFFDDFVENTAREYARTLDFLNVHPGFAPEFSRVNESRRIRNRILQRILMARPRFVQKAVRTLSPERLRHGVLNFAFRVNAPPARRAPMDPRLRTELSAYFEPDIEELGRLTGRDLGCWVANECVA